MRSDNVKKYSGRIYASTTNNAKTLNATIIIVAFEKVQEPF